MTWTTCIRDADWVVVWVGATGRHQYLKGADAAFTGDAIDFVGAGQPILEDFGFLTLGLGPLMAISRH